MRKITGKINFGDGSLSFSFSGGRMAMDVDTERDFSPFEEDYVNEVIDDIVQICVKLDENIEDFEAERKKAVSFFEKIMPRGRELKKEEERRVKVSAGKIRADAKRIPDREHEGRFFISLNGIWLIEEDGVITDWKMI